MSTDDRRFDHITEKIIGCAYKVAAKLGTGFLEKCYENALAMELRRAGLSVQQQVRLKVWYDDEVVGEYIADLIVEGVVLVEIKAIAALDAVHSAVCINYLAATRLPVCLLINFGKRVQVKRIAGPTLSSSVEIGAASVAKMKTSLSALNAGTEEHFVAVCGRFFEHSPWIARRTWSKGPFESLEDLHRKLCETMWSASEQEQVKLIAAHPDLVGKAARAGTLTRESTAEQRAAGLGDLSPEEIDLFQNYNARYREKFGFPFVICARENRKEAILAAFPLRLENSRESEIRAALSEIAKIAKLRLADAVSET